MKEHDVAWLWAWIALVIVACILGGGAVRMREVRIRSIARAEGYRAAVDSGRAAKGDTLPDTIMVSGRVWVSVR